MKVLTQLVDPRLQLLHPEQSAVLSCNRNIWKRLSRNKDRVKEKESESEKVAKRQTICVFCLDLNEAERKSVGVRRQACKEEKEGKQVGVSGFFLRGEDCKQDKACSACIWREQAVPYSMWLPTSKTTLIILIATMVPVVGAEKKSWWWEELHC